MPLPLISVTRVLATQAVGKLPVTDATAAGAAAMASVYLFSVLIRARLGAGGWLGLCFKHLPFIIIRLSHSRILYICLLSLMKKCSRDSYVFFQTICHYSLFSNQNNHRCRSWNFRGVKDLHEKLHVLT